MNNSNKKNINWINAAKALSIIAVYYVHCTNYYGYRIGQINDYIHPFYVNAFFFVSGYLLFRKQLSTPVIDEKCEQYIRGCMRQYLSNIFYRIIVPSILFASVEYVPKNLLRGRGLDISNFLWETIGGRTYWFTSALVVAQIIILLLLLLRFRKIWIYWLCSLCVMAGGFYMVEQNANFLGLAHDLWQFKHGLLSIAFLSSGGLYWRYERTIQRYMNRGVFAVMSIVYFFMFTIFSEDFHVLISLLDINWIGYCAGCFASILLIEICKYLPQVQPLTFIGQNSISFYFMSGALPIVMSMIANLFLDELRWYGLMLVWMLSLLIAYGATSLFNKYTPWLFDLRPLFLVSRQSCESR